MTATTGILLSLAFLTYTSCGQPPKYGDPASISSGPPKLVENLEDAFFVVGEPNILNCKAYGDQTPTITWYKDRQPVDNSSLLNLMTSEGQLFFLQVKQTDAGEYYCKATNIYGTTISRIAHITVSDCNDRSLEQLCIRPNTTSVCSGRGTCVCGVCECNARRAHTSEKYSGQYCHCDDYSCPFHGLRICGGHGRCDCGRCVCDEGYTGEACDCPISQDACMTDQGVVCNGRGVCECGVCRCDPHSSYRGPTCEECPTCPGPCYDYKACVLCKVFGTGPYDEEACAEKCTDRIVSVNKLVERWDARTCRIYDDDHCLVTFSYRYDSHGNKTFRVLSTADCTHTTDRNVYQQTDSNDAAITRNSPAIVILLLGGLGLIIHYM